MADPVETEHPLAVHARRYVDVLSSENARSNYIVRLQGTTDVAVVRGVARQYGLTPQISIPAWLRVAALSGDDAALLLEAASALYSQGMDEIARQLIDRTLEADSKSIPALELKAALTPDPLMRRRVFEEILKIDPGNRVAVDNLILLDRPK